MTRRTGGRLRPFVGAALVAACLGGAVIGVGGGAGATTSVARHELGRCKSSNSIVRTQKCASKSLDPYRTESVTSGEVKVTATGRGTVSVGYYNTDPSKAFTYSTGTYFGVMLAVPNAFTSLTVKDCDIAGGAVLYWLDGNTWVPVVLQPGSIGSSSLTCITVTLGATSSPSVATIIKLSRLSRLGAALFSVR